jgi:ubiquinone/menaquinone biosynthesis C-methylase UbiE
LRTLSATSESPSRERDLAELRAFMAEHVRRDAEKLYGLSAKHGDYLNMVVDRWFDDVKNYDGRWGLLDSRLPSVGKVLDMASGCGSFVINGLRNGRDVWGIEPEDWKLEYFRRKVASLDLPPASSNRVVKSFGETLPFDDGTFDVATSYQTIEHVADVGACLDELLRVVKPGGVVHVSSPDYDSFFEPHYLVPFLPTMNRRLASAYLSLLGRPTLGLRYLNWVTEKSVLSLLERSRYRNSQLRLADLAEPAIREKITNRLPAALRAPTVIDGVRKVQRLRQGLRTFLQSGPVDGSIDLWIVKA